MTKATKENRAPSTCLFFVFCSLVAFVAPLLLGITRTLRLNESRFPPPDHKRFNAALVDVISQPRARRRLDHAAGRDGPRWLDDVFSPVASRGRDVARQREARQRR